MSSSQVFSDNCLGWISSIRIYVVSSLGNALLTMVKFVVTGDDSKLYNVNSYFCLSILFEIIKIPLKVFQITTIFFACCISCTQEATQEGQSYSVGDAIIANIFRYLGTFLMFYLLRQFFSVFVLIAYTSLKAYTKHMPSVQTVSSCLFF